MFIFNLIKRNQHIYFTLVLIGLFALSGCNKTVNTPTVQSYNSDLNKCSITSKKNQSKKQTILKVALLTPLSGQHSKLGAIVEQAAELALFTKNIANFDLAIYDTQSTATGAQSALKKAIDDKCTAVVGPIFTDDIIAIKTMARAHKIPVLSLSNNAAIADDNTFVLGLSPLDQAVAALNYTNDRNLTDVLTVLPQNQLGQAIATKIKNISNSNTIIFYDPKQLSTLEHACQEIQKGSVQVLFIPEGGAALARIISALIYANIDLKKIQLIGSSLWDESVTRNNPSLQNAVITATDPSYYERFENEFKKNYGTVPPKIASIGYDAVILLITAKKHFDTKALMPANITHERGYLGANGTFTLMPNGSVKRTYSILQLQNNRFVSTKYMQALTQ